MGRIVIDRIDRAANVAHLEIRGRVYMVPADSLPASAQEGDIVAFKILDSTSIKKNIANIEGRLFK